MIGMMQIKPELMNNARRQCPKANDKLPEHTRARFGGDWMAADRISVRAIWAAGRTECVQVVKIRWRYLAFRLIPISFHLAFRWRVTCRSDYFFFLHA
jgi:hypothetical protein